MICATWTGTYIKEAPQVKKFWALIANSSYAKILEIKGCGKEVHLIEDIPFPEGRLKGKEITNERPGRAFDSQGHSRHAMSSRVDPHEHEVEVFAKQLGSHLHKAHSENRFEELALIAPPHFLGQINLHLSDSVKNCIVKEVGKDLPEWMNEKERMDLVAKYLDLWNR